MEYSVDLPHVGPALTSNSCYTCSKDDILSLSVVPIEQNVLGLMHIHCSLQFTDRHIVGREHYGR